MKKVFILVMLGISMLLLGCLQQQAAEPGIKYICSDGTVVDAKTQCTAAASEAGAPQEMTTERELEICAGMPLTQAGSFENMCIMGLAAKHKDAALCRKVSQEQRVSCYAFIAELKNNPDECLQAEFMKDQCYEQYSRDKRDASVCGKISDLSYKDRCYSGLTVCDKITDLSYKDSCYSQLASQQGDATLCDKIRNSNQKDNCYFSVAQRLGDAAYCDRISSSTQKQHCLQSVGAGQK